MTKNPQRADVCLMRKKSTRDRRPRVQGSHWREAVASCSHTALIAIVECLTGWPIHPAPCAMGLRAERLGTFARDKVFRNARRAAGFRRHLVEWGLTS